MDDPRPLAGDEPPKQRAAFTRLASAIKVGPTWKTSAPGRHRAADRAAVAALESPRPVVLDVGAADGVTSLELMERMGMDFAQFFVTDRTLELLAARRGKMVFFYSSQGELLLAASPRLVAYADLAAADPLSRHLAGRMLRAAPRAGLARRVWLVQPELRELARRDSRVALRAHDIFSPWPGPGIDLIKAANLLNPDYFSPAQLRRALGHLGRALNPGGLLLLADNEPGPAGRLCFSLFRRGGDGLEMVEEQHGGARAAGLARQVRLGGEGA
jgi:SAM-dependent methyltransferase